MTAVGAVLLLFGRKLFWLFCAALGFLIGTTLAPMIAPGASETVILAAGVAMGLLGAFLGSTVRSIGTSIAGFAGGALAIQQVMTYLNLNAGSAGVPNWVVLLVGGVIGILVLSAVFDWAVIILAALTGAGFVIQGLTAMKIMPNSWAQLGFVALLLIGVVWQLSSKRGD